MTNIQTFMAQAKTAYSGMQTNSINLFPKLKSMFKKIELFMKMILIYHPKITFPFVKLYIHPNELTQLIEFRNIKDSVYSSFLTISMYNDFKLSFYKIYCVSNIDFKNLNKSNYITSYKIKSIKYINGFFPDKRINTYIPYRISVCI